MVHPGHVWLHCTMHAYGMHRLNLHKKSREGAYMCTLVADAGSHDTHQTETYTNEMHCGMPSLNHFAVGTLLSAYCRTNTQMIRRSTFSVYGSPCSRPAQLNPASRRFSSQVYMVSGSTKRSRLGVPGNMSSVFNKPVVLLLVIARLT